MELAVITASWLRKAIKIMIDLMMQWRKNKALFIVDILCGVLSLLH